MFRRNRHSPVPSFHERRSIVVALSVSVAAFGVGCGDSGHRDQQASAASPSGSASTSAPPASASSSASTASAEVLDAGAPPELPRLTTPLPEEDLYPEKLDEQREAMLRRMKVMLRLGDEQIDSLRKVMQTSPIIGQGNPEIVKYAITRKECRERREAANVIEVEHPVCGAPFMVPLYDPRAGETEADARACIDEFEFPDMPCDYPVTWVSSHDAAKLCEAAGKRICDAHEWEGGCAGAVHSPDVEYAWGKPRKEMKNRHNAEREIVWAYGPEKDHGKCATDSKKSEKCEKSGWKKCGSNTYPSGSFPACRSPLGVWDQHGNVAEHMNMPLRPKELASRGGSGETEMKGSWFIFKGFEAHEDDCRWRAPDWHVTKLMSPDSHANYHLGFRCCKTIGSAETDH